MCYLVCIFHNAQNQSLAMLLVNTVDSRKFFIDAGQHNNSNNDLKFGADISVRPPGMVSPAGETI